MALFAELGAEGLTIVVITHDMTVAQRPPPRADQRRQIV